MSRSADRAPRVALALALVAAACGAARARAPAEDPARIVALVPSPKAEITRGMSDGLRLALDRACRDGGPEMTLHVGDVAGAWSTVASTAVELSRMPGVVALVAPPERRLAHPVAQLATRAQVPVVSTSSAASVLATGSTWVVGIAPLGASASDEPVAPAFDATSPRARAFVAAFVERHGVVPDAWAALGYEAGRRLALALRRAGRGGAALASALADPSLAEGSVLGAVSGPSK